MRAIVVVALVCLLSAAVPQVQAYRSYATAAMEAAPSTVTLTAAEAEALASRKVSCPFVGSLVSSQRLKVYQSAAAPLAFVSDVKAAANTGAGSTLGLVLELFATGNHAKQIGPSGRLDAAVPAGMFALDFPGSKGAHWGHSGILEGEPTALNTGRWSQADFDRLISKADGNGLLSLGAVGQYIAQNIRRDLNSKVLETGVVGLFISDTANLLRGVAATVASLLKGGVAPTQLRQIATDFTKILGDDNLVGSAGEFGLLFAFLERSPRSSGGSISVADVTSMFKAHRMPAGWESWPKSALSWSKFSAALAYHARVALSKHQ